MKEKKKIKKLCRVLKLKESDFKRCMCKKIGKTCRQITKQKYPTNSIRAQQWISTIPWNTLDAIRGMLRRLFVCKEFVIECSGQTLVVKEDRERKRESKNSFIVMNLLVVREYTFQKSFFMIEILIILRTSNVCSRKSFLCILSYLLEKK